MSTTTPTITIDEPRALNTQNHLLRLRAENAILAALHAAAKRNDADATAAYAAALRSLVSPV